MDSKQLFCKYKGEEYPCSMNGNIVIMTSGNFSDITSKGFAKYPGARLDVACKKRVPKEAVERVYVKEYKAVYNNHEYDFEEYNRDMTKALISASIAHAKGSATVRAWVPKADIKLIKIEKEI